MATNDSLQAHDLFVNITRDAPRCSKGWEKRCPQAKGAHCRCQCRGDNHGQANQSWKLEDVITVHDDYEENRHLSPFSPA